MLLEKAFKDYYLKLCLFASTFIKDGEVAKDIAQEAFIILSQKPDVLDKGELVVKSFLYTTVKNISLNHIRQSKSISNFDNVSDYETMEKRDYLADIIQTEIIVELHKLLNKLPSQCSTICKLIYLEEKSYKEVADELNVSINTIKTQRQRALKYLRLAYGKELLVLLSVNFLFHYQLVIIF